MCKIISFASGKGGVGKSIISANISSVLASRGYKVGIFDASIGLANLDIVFNQKIKNNLLNVLNKECDLKDCTVKIDDNLVLVPSESGSEIFNYTPEEIYSSVIACKEFMENLDYLIIDCGSGIGEYVEIFTKNADEVIVLTIPDPTAITDAYTLIKTTALVNEHINLIVNSVENEREGQFIYEKIKKVIDNNFQNATDLNFLGSIDNSRIVSRSLKLRKLFTKINPNSVVSSQIDDIVDNIILEQAYNPLNKRKKDNFVLFLKRAFKNL